MKRSFLLDGHRVAQAREALDTCSGHVSQTAFAEMVGVHAVTMNRIENGKTRVSLALLERIASVTNRSREWLLGEPEQVDEIDAAREQIASALLTASRSFDEFSTALDALVARARVVAEEKVA